MSCTFPADWNDLRVVFSHDWLTGMRGGERVLELLCRAFPDAPVFTLLHVPGAISPVINAHPVYTSWLQRLPGISRRYRYFLPFFPAAVAGLRAPPADLLISTSHCAAKGLRPPSGAKHLCYCFTPMRYAWTFYDEYFGGNPLRKALFKPMLAALRRWDRRTSDRVDRFVAISRHVQERIKRFYGRDADVVYPPVETEFYTPGASAAQNYDLIVSALVPYKRVDLAVRAYDRLGFPLKVVGIGTETPVLRKSAAANIEFLGWKSNEEIRDLYRGCRCLVFSGEEDFGIVPVEAQSCGRPVVAFRRGGALETVIENVTGVFFDDQTEEALLDAVQRCASGTWNGEVIRKNAMRFGVQHFLDGLAASVRAVLGRA